ncbi:MAG: hypothetical protein FWE23_11400 [Chitinivibrionia bacterium]|nr:hypothetical protein [Chitinivibrionia bacterium]
MGKKNIISCNVAMFKIGAFAIFVFIVMFAMLLFSNTDITIINTQAQSKVNLFSFFAFTCSIIILVVLYKLLKLRSKLDYKIKEKEKNLDNLTTLYELLYNTKKGDQ